MIILDQIKLFNKHCVDLQSHYVVEQLCEHGFLISPEKPIQTKKKIFLTIMALTHGNEIAGIGVLNRILTALLKKEFQLPFSLCVVLGNVEAAKVNKRFMISDLNRSFAASSPKTSEQIRAAFLEKNILSNTHYFIDLHQTIEPTTTPFFIFPFSLGGFRLANKITKDLPIVTHWSSGSGGFSQDGCCSDEFVNRNGGVGVSLELGRMGYDALQVGFAFRLVTNLISAFNLQDPHAEFIAPATIQERNTQVWTWSHVENYPKDVSVELREGLHNFMVVEKGEQLGLIDNKPYLAPVAGPILFPKYHRDLDAPRPAELIRYLKKQIIKV